MPNQSQQEDKRTFLELDGLSFHRRAHLDAYATALELLQSDASRGRLIDLGAGSGYTSYQLARAGFDVVALDVHADQFVPQDIPFLQHDLNQRLPLQDAEADAVLALEIIEHLENPRYFLREIARVLRPGGALVLSTPNIVSLKSRWRFLRRTEFHLFYNQKHRTNDRFCEAASGHITPLLPWLLEIFLEDAGLELQQKYYTRTKRLGLRSALFSDNAILKALRR